MRLITVYCYRCGWNGTDPSFTDDSDYDRHGTYIRPHPPICPKCFSDDVHVQPRPGSVFTGQAA